MPLEIGPLVAVLVFAGIFLLGSETLIPGALRSRRRRFLSFGAGLTIAYVFVHLLPELEAARAALVRTGAYLSLPFPALRVYLAALVGFLLFYGLEHLVEWNRRPAADGTGQEGGSRAARFAHAGVFLGYVFLAGYLTVRRIEEGPTPLTLYAVALGLHFVSLDSSFRREYGAWYDRSVRYAFAAAPPAGWAVGLILGFSQTFTAALLGFLAGGVIMNAIVGELPKEKDGRFLYLLLGGAFYTALLILLA